jgi:hypothetical protein
LLPGVGTTCEERLWQLIFAACKSNTVISSLRVVELWEKAQNFLFSVFIIPIALVIKLQSLIELSISVRRCSRLANIGLSSRVYGSVDTNQAILCIPHAVGGLRSSK